MKKALFVLTNHTRLGNTGKQTGWYLPEVAHPYYVLENAGFEIDFTSPEGGMTKPDENSLNLEDGDNRRFFESRELMEKTRNTLPAAEVRAGDYQVIYYAGGHGTMWDFPDNKKLADIAAAIYERGGIVGAVCHGTSGLLGVTLSDSKRLIENKSINSFTNEEEEELQLTDVVPFLLETKLTERGAIFRQGKKFTPFVITDERVVTGQNEFSARAVGEQIIKLIGRKQ